MHTIPDLTPVRICGYQTRLTYPLPAPQPRASNLRIIRDNTKDEASFPSRFNRPR